MINQIKDRLAVTHFPRSISERVTETEEEHLRKRDFPLGIKRNDETGKAGNLPEKDAHYLEWTKEAAYIV